MDSKLLLVKCITLLFRESQLPNQGNSGELCREVLDSIRLPEATMEVNNGREVLVALRSTLLWMIDNHGSPEAFDKGPLLQQIKVNTKDEEYLYQSFLISIDDAEEETILKEVAHHRTQLRNHLKSAQVNDLIKKAFNTMIHDNHLDYTDFARELSGQLEPYTQLGEDTKIGGVVDTLSFNSEEDLDKYLTQAMEEISGEGVLKTGWQALNRMMGNQGGIRRGEMVMIPALPHNFKTGMILNLYKHFGLYNTPHMRDETKKPLILLISAENEMSVNILWLYANLKENETGEPVDTRNIDVPAARQYIMERLQATGYHFQMMRVNPSDYSIYDYIDTINDYESKGFEIHACLIDYLQMWSKKGCNQGPHGTEIRDIFRRVRNIGSPRGIATITPHQLSTEAKNMIRTNPDGFLAEIAQKGYYDGCKSVDQEIDLEIYIHITKKDGRSYLEFQRGKHRAASITDLVHQAFILPFQPVGGILDDLNGKDSSMKTIKGSGGFDSSDFGLFDE